MFIKRYLVKSMHEAADLIRVELGPDAVILSSHKVRAQGISGLFGRTVYEVIAAVDEDKQAKKSSTKDRAITAVPSGTSRGHEQNYAVQAMARQVYERNRGESVATAERPNPANHGESAKSSTAVSREVPKTETPQVRKWEPERVEVKKLSSSPVQQLSQASSPETVTPLTTPAKAQPTPITATPKVADVSNRDSVMNELKELRSMLAHFVMDGSGLSKNADLRRITELWMGTGLSHSLAERFLTKLQMYQTTSMDEQNALTNATRALISESLDGVGAHRLIQPEDRYVALVGPTGVGKTTTIAKLAAHAKLKEGRSVGLLTVDTFRVAAVEQLRTYSDILNIPFAVAESSAEVSAALKQLDECDLVLIDTTGRSFLDQEQIEELKNFLEPVPLDLVYLVISMTARPAEAIKVAELLRSVRYEALLFTKADESLLPSLAITMADQLGLPLSYISGGQNVPSDLYIAEKAWFLERFAGGVHSA